jgi:hypothetical protein
MSKRPGTTLLPIGVLHIKEPLWGDFTEKWTVVFLKKEERIRPPSSSPHFDPVENTGQAIRNGGTMQIFRINVTFLLLVANIHELECIDGLDNNGILVQLFMQYPVGNFAERI